MDEKKFILQMSGIEKFIETDSSKHILDAMLSVGLNKAPKGCHGGGCGVCKIKILQGDVHTLSQSRKYLSLDEEKAGFVLACRAYPLSDIEFEFIGKAKVNEKKKYGFV